MFIRTRHIALLLIILFTADSSFAAQQPNMTVEGNGITINDTDIVPAAADGTDLGNVDTSSYTDQVFTIRNSGKGNLLLTGTTPYVNFTGAEAGDFTVISQPTLTTLAQNDTTNFTVRFAPGATGLREARIEIPNSHSSAKNPYDFSIQGTGTSSVSVPTLTTPLASTIEDTTAFLGATITDDGGDTILSRGTVWDTSPTLTANLLAEGGTAIEPFSHQRTLPEATRIYFAGYATNSGGTGYSSDGSFYTEPTIQASGITFSVTVHRIFHKSLEC